MAGNSKRSGAVRKRRGGNPTAGSGGRGRRALEGKGPTPKAADREHHKAHRKAAADDRRTASKRPSGRKQAATAEWVAGRNSVVEALQSGIPVTTVYVAERAERDDRLREAFRLAAERKLSVLEVTRQELDRMTDRAVHQGIALKVPAYEYADPGELLDRAASAGDRPLLVLLDSVTDPRNLGAVVRSAEAFGAHGVVVPQRRAAGMTASAWKAAAGAAARLPVARATNLTRQLKDYQAAGVVVVGLDASATVDLADLDDADGPLAIVVGSEDKGLSRLVRETCDVLVRIPMSGAAESLNASVAAAIVLYEVDRRRSRR